MPTGLRDRDPPDVPNSGYIMSDNKTFKVFTGQNDPRGSHCVVCDSDDMIVSRTWKETDANKIKDMLKSGEIKPNYESRYINIDVDEILKGNIL